MPGTGDECNSLLQCKTGTAARHTYDVGYSKWEAFDVEAALQEVDRCDSRARRESKAKIAAQEGIDRSKDPKELLDAAISKLQKAQEVQELDPAAVENKEVNEDDASMCRDDAGESGVSNICLADAGDTTGHQLAAEYQKWEDFDDDLEEDDLDGGVDSSGMDLNALTGPADEVKQIQAHWRREAVKMAKTSRKPRVVASPPAKEVAMVPGPVLERPCLVAPAAGRLEENYDKWKKFDADAALLELDNEDTTEEGKTMRLSAGQGSAMLNCEGYTKDREEYDLDQDIERNMGGLKQILAQNFKDASGLKAEGNDLMRSGRLTDAIRKYRDGLDALHLAREASVLMTPSLAAKQSNLVADLYKNLSCAQLKSNDFAAALASADEALKVCDDDKARYRRAMALLKLNRLPDARKEVESLATSADPAVQKLLAEVSASSLP